ncbi:hypothetical protein [Thalassotalea sp. PS06]|uniref:hypothetical protein n=1 Tax=Thalassotalea sp. PS06 TaxID=2594005 RepID=UPI0011657B0D|nr:hypothetical protein [Thalassotalea sp. PS06]QDP02295.1 hypothetical protein FNC98_13655 [Thalassotalea sp. PS06]
MDIESFSEDLKGRYLACRSLGKLNYVLAYLFLILATVSSAAAALSIALGYLSPAGNAALAGLPGILYVANRLFRFEEKSKWWYEKFYVIEGLYRELVREGQNEKTVSEELTVQSRELAKRWPGFGEAPY